MIEIQDLFINVEIKKNGTNFVHLLIYTCASHVYVTFKR